MNHNRILEQNWNWSVVVIFSFGIGGWRAEIGKDFYIGNILLIAQALANRIQNRR